VDVTAYTALNGCCHATTATHHRSKGGAALLVSYLVLLLLLVCCSPFYHESRFLRYNPAVISAARTRQNKATTVSAQTQFGFNAQCHIAACMECSSLHQSHVVECKDTPCTSIDALAASLLHQGYVQATRGLCTNISCCKQTMYMLSFMHVCR
jgi:hypothetical protein